MAVEVRLSLVNLSFRRHVKAKYHPDQSFSSSFPCWVGLKLYKVDPFRWLLGRTLTFLHRRPAVPCCLKENYSQNNKCHAVVTWRHLDLFLQSDTVGKTSDLSGNTWHVCGKPVLHLPRCTLSFSLSLWINIKFLNKMHVIRKFYGLAFHSTWSAFRGPPVDPPWRTPRRGNVCFRQRIGYFRWITSDCAHCCRAPTSKNGGRHVWFVKMVQIIGF